MRDRGSYPWVVLLSVTFLTSALLAPRGWQAICQWVRLLLWGPG
jgi:hypothetical protein